MGKILNLFMILIFFTLIGFLAYQIYEILPAEQQDLSVFLKQEKPIINASSEFSQFVDNMRFAYSDISFYIYPECNQDKSNRMRQAFQILSQETQILNFNERNVAENTDIKIYCSELQKQTKKDYFIAGEGGPDQYLNLELYPLILSGEIYLYDSRYTKNCAEPLVELHELLHVFGFDHVDKENSIMYPYSSCNQEIDTEIINEIIRIYSIPSRADLHFKTLEASKSGRYLDFSVDIFNRGIIKSTNTKLEIYRGEKLIDSFELEEIEPGVTKTFSIRNLVLDSRNTQEILFKITSETQEYFYDNNEAIAKLE